MCTVSSARLRSGMVSAVESEVVLRCILRRPMPKERHECMVPAMYLGLQKGPLSASVTRV
jgi:hypothetical protein